MTESDIPDVFDMPLTGGIQMKHIGNRMWLQTSESGMSMFLYESADTDGNLQFEMMSTDYVQNNGSICGTVAYYAFVLFGVICIVVFVIKGLLFLIRKIRKRGRTVTTDKRITLQQAIQAVSGVILFCLISVIGPKGYTFAVFSCIMAVVLAAISFLNGIFLLRDKERAKLKQYVWAVFCFGYTAVIVWFQLYDFVHI